MSHFDTSHFPFFVEFLVALSIIFLELRYSFCAFDIRLIFPLPFFFRSLLRIASNHSRLFLLGKLLFGKLNSWPYNQALWGVAIAAVDDGLQSTFLPFPT
jgi:hypothetical protein